MSYKIAAAAALATLASTVSAHGHLQSIDIAGTTYPGWTQETKLSNITAWSTTVTDNGYVSDYTSPDMICHRGAENAQISAPVNGGESVTFSWDTWPTSHKGPVITYLAKCDGDCSTVDKSSLKWFKIDAGGLINGDGSSGNWASDKLISNGFKYDVKIPDSIASGNYVARHEIIALHSANNEGGAQNYPQCVNLEIKSSGSDELEGVVGTELYTAQDKGIFVNIYYPAITSYDMPGPALYTGSGSGSAPASSAAASSAPASSAQASSTYAAPASSSAQATSSYAAPSSAQATSYAASSAEYTSSAASSSAAAFTTQAAVVSSAADDDNDYVVTATQTDVVTQSTAITITAGASATAAVSDIASAIPSEMLTSTISAGVPTATASSGVAKPTKALPEGTTLEDLLSWVEYLFSEASTKTATKHRRHARAFRH